VAFVTSDGTVVESDRSTPLQVTVTGSAPPAEATVPQESTIDTSDGHRLRASIAARGLDDPTDLAVAPDGRVFVTERAGRVRILGADGASLEDALELDDVLATEDSGLTTIALHPDFDRSGLVYLAFTAEAPDSAIFRIARFRERGGTLAQGGVIARERTRSAQHVVLRFGSDGKLYAGFATGNDPREAQNASSVLGKILRLNDDGTIPRDNPGASPVFSTGHRDPRGLAWHGSSGAMWEAERDGDAGDELNSIVGGANYGWPLTRGAGAHPQTVPAALVLPPGTEVSGARVVPLASSSPFAGELLVTARGAEELLRIRFGPTGRPGLVEGLLQGRFGRIGAIDVSADGTVYLATANRDTWGPGRDVLIAVSVAAAR
jgi:glucose/arabinose dehydrogenase